MTNAPYLKQADSGVWYVHWTVDRIGKRVSTKTKDHAAAAAFLADWLKFQGLKTLVPQTMILADVWKFYRVKHKVASEYAADLAWKMLDPHFGKINCEQLRQSTIDEYVRQRTTGRLGRTVKDNTAAKELSYLLAAVKFCAKRNIVPASCIRSYDLPAAGEPRDRWLKTSEIQALLAAAGRMRQLSSNPLRLSRAERFLWLALETAGRCQALLDLTWDRVDFETGMISLNVPGRKRTRKRRADVPMSKALRPIMERAYAERTGNVVLDHGGAIWADIQTVTIEAGLAPKQVVARGSKPKATGISPHVLRHTAATHMARRGVSLFHIAKVLGNSVQVCEKTYAKYSPGDLQRAVDLISGEEN